MASDVRIVLFSFVMLAASVNCSEFGLKFVTDLIPETIGVPGSAVTLQCTTNLPVDSIVWYLNHEAISAEAIVRENVSNLATSGSQLYSIHTEDRASYIIIPLEESSHLHSRKTGIYQCIAVMGSVKLASSPCRLDIAVIEDFFPATPLNLVAAEGEALRIPCPALHSVPPPVFSFTKDGQPLEDQKVIVTAEGELLLLSASLATAGSYQCVATNSVLNTTLVAPPATVDVRPTAVLKPKIVNPTSSSGLRVVREGNSTTLHCLVTGRDKVSAVWWSKEGSFLENAKQLHVAGQSAVSSLLSLTIDSVAKQHAGDYTCHARWKGEEQEAKLKLFIEVAPEINCSLSSSALVEGDNLEGNCHLDGVPFPVFHCLNNGENLAQREGVSVGRDGHLVIQDIKKNYSGVLQCFAHNSVGSSSFNSFLTVVPNTVEQDQHSESTSENTSENTQDRGNKLGKKAAPSAVVPSKISSDAVQLCWKPPSATIPGNGLLFYKVQYKLKKEASPPLLGAPGRRQQQWWTDDTAIPPHSSCHTLLGFNVNSTYKFRVAAVYTSHDNVVSRPSKWFEITPDEPLLRPPAPKLLTVTQPTTNGSIELSWSYQSSVPTDGFIISYKVIGKEKYFNSLRYLGGFRRTIAILELPQKNNLAFYVQAFNMAGSSGNSNVKYFLSGRATAELKGAALAVNSSESVDRKVNFLLSPPLPDNNSNEHDSDEYDEEGDSDESNTDDSFSSSTGLSSLHLLIILSCLLFLLLLIVLIPSVLRAYRNRRNNARDAVTQIEVECPITGGCSAVTPLQLSQMCQNNTTSNINKQSGTVQMRPLLTEPD